MSLAGDITAVVLAGGKSRRFGSDKASALLAGRPMLQWVVDAVAEIAAEVVIVAAAGQAFPEVACSVPLRIVRDRDDGLGPLAGMVAGFEESKSDVCLVVSCDAPLLVPELLRYLIGRGGPEDAVVLPEVGGRWQPLVGVYRTERSLPAFRERVRSGERGVVSAIEALGNVVVVAEAEVKQRDPELRSFFGVNTAEEFARLERVVSELLGN
jgi:molybdopterin-guanine dinucleotide biosynthesis protein A